MRAKTIWSQKLLQTKETTMLPTLSTLSSGKN